MFLDWYQKMSPILKSLGQKGSKTQSLGCVSGGNNQIKIGDTGLDLRGFLLWNMSQKESWRRLWMSWPDKKKINVVSPAEKSKIFSADQDTSLVFVVSADKHRDLARDGKYDYTVTRLKIVTAIFSQRKDIEGTNILTKQIKISKWNFCD